MPSRSLYVCMNSSMRCNAVSIRGGPTRFDPETRISDSSQNEFKEDVKHKASQAFEFYDSNHS